MSEENMNNEDYLKAHIGSQESANRPVPEPIDYDDQVDVKKTTVKDLNYFHYDVKLLPCGKFYPEGTAFMIRPATVKEVQAYSMVDDTNTIDIVEKMNDMLQSCVKVKFPGDRMGSYLDIKDQDRIPLIMMIRDMTFQNRKSLTVPAVCPTDETEVNIEISLQNFVYREENEKYKKYFDRSIDGYRFKLKNDKEFRITLPTIGMQKAFTDFIIKQANDGKKINKSFIKIMPFLMDNRSKITEDGINAKLKEFENMDMDTFMFLNATVDDMKFGIKELVKRCDSCGEEVRTDFTFPDSRASAIFVIHTAFEDSIED